MASSCASPTGMETPSSEMEVNRITPVSTGNTNPQGTHSDEVDAKKRAIEYIEEVDSSSGGGDECDVGEVEALSHDRQAYTPFLRKGPLLGLCALIFQLLTIPASFLVLAMSNGRPVTSWKFQPTVYLAIMTAVGNSVMRFAAVQGCMIVWWTHAMRGTTFAQLHQDWKMSIGAVGALTAGRYTNFIAVASLCATFVIVDGPLLQRASSVVSKTPAEPISLHTLLSPEIPAYFSGFSILDTDHPTNDFSSEFYSVFSNWTAGSPITSAITGCPGVCTATVQAAALAMSTCSSHSMPIDYTKPLVGNQTAVYDECRIAPTNLDAFTITLATALDGLGNERLDLKVGMTDTDVAKTCVGEFTTKTCHLVSATAEYDVTISNGNIDLEQPPRILNVANNTRINNQTISQFNLRFKGQDWLHTTLGGLSMAAAIQFMTLAGLMPSMANGDNPSLTGSNAFSYKMITNENAWDEETDCAPAWKDPTTDILAALNELMFRASVYTAQAYNETYLKARMDPGLNVSSVVQGTRHDPINVFHVNYYYFLAAALVQLISVLLIAYTFFGWWRLGREVSFSPLEIAKAFEAPLLQGVKSNTNAKEIARVMDERKVRYGVFGRDEMGSERKMGFGDPDVVCRLKGFTKKK
ncbi:hypothetical protein EV356DRAFT_503389 [Viridothelium virens]|uniref:Uncharacterized protein n=1 Tax=Viridothelium virens TaxID=1048519 RepID=A0A6A6H6X9_VIRVR|nr:hypothetical protein EV356DRAFT_503389 [Viridothelium virens]